MLIHQQSHQGRIILQPKFLRRDRSLPLAERTAAHHEGLSLCHISFIEETQGLRLGPYLGGTLNNLPSIQTLIYLKFWLCLNPSYLQSCPCLSEIGGRGETQQSYSSATLCVLLIGCSPPPTGSVRSELDNLARSSASFAANRGASGAAQLPRGTGTSD